MRYDSSISQICSLHESIESLSVGQTFQFVILVYGYLMRILAIFPAKLDAAVNEL
jgi:hypothetical protein